MVDSKLTVISYIGNIGSGKTSRLEKLKNDGHIVVKENLDLWKKLKMLDKFYANKKLYAYDFQHMVLISNFLDMKKCSEENMGKTVYLERSIIDARYVFVETLHEDNDIDDDLFTLYCWWYTEIVEKYLKIILPHKFIYLRTKPEVCLERIKKRGRESEKSITIDYLQKLDKKYETLVKKLKTDGYDVEIVDGNVADETLM
jgi:deoxyadenosine/deoxycytidine kinase